MLNISGFALAKLLVYGLMKMKIASRLDESAQQKVGYHYAGQISHTWLRRWVFEGATQELTTFSSTYI